MSVVAKLIDSLSDANDGIWKEKLRKAVNILLTIEDWREIGSVGNPDFENSWADAGANPAFYKDPYGHVHLKGELDTGASGTTAFTLPEGYRPSEELFLAMLQSSGAAGSFLTVTTAGLVQPTKTGTNAVLNGISFRI